MQYERMLLRSLGIAHVLVAIVLLPAATFLGIFTIPVVVPGVIWLAVLGVRLWRPSPKVCRALRVTRTLLVPFAVLLVLYGWYCLRAAQRSAEAGGGLLGAFGLIPIVMGVLAGTLAIVSLFAAKSKAFMKTTDAEQGVGGDSGRAADRPTGAPQR